MIQVDAGAIEEKFINLFDKIDTNRNLKQFKNLELEYVRLTEKETVPEVLKSRATIADREIKDGLRVLRDWSEEIKNISDILNDHSKKIENALEVINLTERLRKKYVELFEKYESSELNDDLENLLNKANDGIYSNFNSWLSTLKCTSEEDVIDLRVIEKSVGDKLIAYDYKEYAEKLSDHINKETKDIEIIKEKASLKRDLEGFISRNSINEYTPIQVIDDIVERGRELAERIKRIVKTTDEQTTYLVRQFMSKLERTQAVKDEIDKSIADVRNSIKSISSIQDITEIRNRINKLFGRGIDEKKYPEFSIFLQESLQFQEDYSELKNSSESICRFTELKEILETKYSSPSMDYGQLKILSKEIDTIASEFTFKESRWRRENLDFEGKDRKFLINWKDQIQNVPDYLTEKTLKDIETAKQKVEDILSSQNIQTVIEYFEKLSSEEKKKCFEELSKRI